MCAEDSKPTTRTSPAAKLGLVALGIVMVLAVLGIAELALGIAGVGPSRHLFLRHKLAGEEVWQLNREVSQFFFPKWVERPLAHVVLPVRKPGKDYRIIATGESSTLGDPYGYQTAYPALLGEMLADVAPARTYEIANCACVAISSLDVLWIHQRALRYDPDAILIYTGHNEVVGADGIDTPLQRSFRSRGAAMFWMWFRNLHLPMLVRSLFVSEKPPSNVDPAGEGFGMWTMQGRMVPACSEKHERMLRFYRENILAMLKSARSRGVDVILCTQIGNVRDQSPMGAVHGCNFNPADEPAWQAAYDRGVAAQNSGDWSAARVALEECRRLDPDHAVARFRLGRCLDALGDSSAAFAEYIAARDLDPVHFRACSAENDVLRRVAREWDTQGRHRFLFVDLDSLLQVDYPYGAGNTFFTEHVHPYPKGHAWIARQIVTAMAHSPLAAELGECDLTRLGSPASYVERSGLTPLDEAAGLILTDLHKLAKWPFTTCYDNAAARARVQAQIDSLGKLLNPVELKLFSEIPTDPTGDAYDYAARHYSLYTQYRMRRQGPEALRELRRARAYWPPLAFVETDMAQIMVATRQLNEAERYLNRARDLDPGYAPIHFVAGALHHARGEREAAAKEFSAYLEADATGPYAAAARQGLAALSQAPR